MSDALAVYHRRRDAAVLPMYRYTAQRAQLSAPDVSIRRLLEALVDNQPERDRFAGITAGITPVTEFFAPDNVSRIVSGRPARAA